MTVVTPIVHRNGTSPGELLQQRSELRIALAAVLGKLEAAAPDGRDYYPEPGKINDAIRQHAARVATINAMMRDIEVEMESIMEADSSVSRKWPEFEAASQDASNVARKSAAQPGTRHRFAW